MESSKTSSQILLEAANLLEEEGKWHKGSFFYSNDKGCSMCAHGAIAYCGNKEVREKLLPALAAAAAGACAEPVRRLRQRTEADARAAREAAEAGALITNLKEKHGEVAVAHYKAFKVGLDYAFNDNPSTTKQDVIDKLREAAQL